MDIYLETEQSVDLDLEAGPHLLPRGLDLGGGEDEAVVSGVPQLRGEGEPGAQHPLVPVVSRTGGRVLGNKFDLWHFICL